ncbi:hypothetical protein KO498_02020 [Lentibacter algarum]|uniref:hypothetical protein n=1 Tax=Lentibacter algarum TaxID=576131 RepID=UPI001C067EA8|nr:hypothetical protein [Lentibacter algarum]MBU2980580.1 hypothetical protein [Lentibacter algarum]
MELGRAEVQPPRLRPGQPDALPTKTAKLVSAPVSGAIAIELKEAARFCGKIKGQEYAIDCLAYEYARIAAALPDTGDYAVIKKELEVASTKLSAVVSKNRSKTLPAGRVVQGGPKPRRTARALRPVATEALPAATAEAVKIIEETQTVLIRSTENSTERRRQFQQIVASMDTGTILLRSV